MNGTSRPGAATAREGSETGDRSGKLLAAGGLLAALGASACCVLPFALITLGVGGAWMGNLTWFAPYEKLFIAAAVLLLAVGFWRVYRRPAACVVDGCAPPGKLSAKTGLWVATLLVAAAIAFPYLAPWL